MADTLVAGTPRRLLVDGRDPAPDEAISAGPDIIVAPPDGNGQTFVSLADTATDGTVETITVEPGAADAGRSAGSDDITFSVPVAPTPLVVTLE